jgi:hypothetical protein
MEVIRKYFLKLFLPLLQSITLLFCICGKNSYFKTLLKNLSTIYSYFKESKPQIWISGDQPIYVYGIPINPKQRHENVVILVKAPKYPVRDPNPIQFHTPDPETIPFDESADNKGENEAKKISNFSSLDNLDDGNSTNSTETGGTGSAHSAGNDSKTTSNSINSKPRLTITKISVDKSLKTSPKPTTLAAIDERTHEEHESSHNSEVTTHETTHHKESPQEEEKTTQDLIVSTEETDHKSKPETDEHHNENTTESHSSDESHSTEHHNEKRK